MLDKKGPKIFGYN